MAEEFFSFSLLNEGLTHSALQRSSNCWQGLLVLALLLQPQSVESSVAAPPASEEELGGHCSSILQYCYHYSIHIKGHSLKTFCAISSKP